MKYEKQNHEYKSFRLLLTSWQKFGILSLGQADQFRRQSAYLSLALWITGHAVTDRDTSIDDEYSNSHVILPQLFYCSSL